MLAKTYYAVVWREVKRMNERMKKSTSLIDAILSREESPKSLGQEAKAKTGSV